MSQPLDELIGSFLESAEELKTRITDLEGAIDRQGIKRMKPGVLVDKEFCKEEHHELIKSMEKLFGEFTHGVSIKIYASWLVLSLFVGGMGLVLKAHDGYIHEIMKVVFK